MLGLIYIDSNEVMLFFRTKPVNYLLDILFDQVQYDPFQLQQTIFLWHSLVRLQDRDRSVPCLCICQSLALFDRLHQQWEQVIFVLH